MSDSPRRDAANLRLAEELGHAGRHGVTCRSRRSRRPARGARGALSDLHRRGHHSWRLRRIVPASRTRAGSLRPPPSTKIPPALLSRDDADWRQRAGVDASRTAVPSTGSLCSLCSDRLGGDGNLADVREEVASAAYTPSTITRLDLDALRRMASSGLYSGESYQRRAASRQWNASSAMCLR